MSGGLATRGFGLYLRTRETPDGFWHQEARFSSTDGYEDGYGSCSQGGQLSTNELGKGQVEYGEYSSGEQAERNNREYIRERLVLAVLFGNNTDNQPDNNEGTNSQTKSRNKGQILLPQVKVSNSESWQCIL